MGGGGGECLQTKGHISEGAKKPDVSFCLLDDGPIIGGVGGGELTFGS